MSERRLRKTRVGKVVSDKMDKTIVVAIEDNVMHPLYKKIIKRTVKFKAHDENNTAGIGDKSRLWRPVPFQRTKDGVLSELLSRQSNNFFNTERRNLL